MQIGPKARVIQVIHDPDRGEGKILVGTDGKGNPWEDLGILLEAVGAVGALVRKAGYSEHNGKPVKEYIHEYLDKVWSDYDKSFQLKQVNPSEQ